MNRKPIIARHEVITEAMLAERAPVGTLVRFVYTYEGTEYVCRGLVTGHEGEQMFVNVTYHQEFGLSKHYQMKMMWSGRIATIVRRPAKAKPAALVVEYRVWCESADLVHVADNLADAEAAMADAIREHVENDCHDGECGVMTAHGYSIQICKDGYDVTGDPSI